MDFKLKNKIQKHMGKDIKASMENKIVGKDDSAYNINRKIGSEIIDNESAYGNSFNSEYSEESQLTNITGQSSLPEIPFQFRSIKTHIIKQDLFNLNKKFSSISKICNSSCILKEKIKYLSIPEIQPSKSVQIQSTRRNMSFTNDEIMKIEHDNEILLKKIIAQQNLQKMKRPLFQNKLSTSAINRKKLQKKIKEDNLMLLRRLQQAKSCAFNTNAVPGYRTTHL